MLNNFVQPAKAYSPISVTVSGMYKSVKEEQLANACEEILCIPFAR